MPKKSFHGNLYHSSGIYLRIRSFFFFVELLDFFFFFKSEQPYIQGVFTDSKLSLWMTSQACAVCNLDLIFFFTTHAE